MIAVGLVYVGHKHRVLGVPAGSSKVNHCRTVCAPWNTLEPSEDLIEPRDSRCSDLGLDSNLHKSWILHVILIVV